MQVASKKILHEKKKNWNNTMYNYEKLAKQWSIAIAD